MSYLLEYGVADTINFPLLTYGQSDFDQTPVIAAAGDCQISIDGVAYVNTTSLFSYIGNGQYALNLTAAELTGAQIQVTLIDQTVPKAYEDQAVQIQTYGDPSASIEGIADGHVADIRVNVDDSGSKDTWTVNWYRNGSLVTTGITNATLRIFDTAGADKWAGSPILLTQIGTTGAYYLERTSTDRIDDGVTYVAEAQATISGATRTARLTISRDARS